MVEGLTAIGVGLSSLGIPVENVWEHEEAIKTGDFVRIAHGSVGETSHAKEVLNRTHPQTLDNHAISGHYA